MASILAMTSSEAQASHGIVAVDVAGGQVGAPGSSCTPSSGKRMYDYEGPSSIVLFGLRCGHHDLDCVESLSRRFGW